MIKTSPSKRAFFGIAGMLALATFQSCTTRYYQVLTTASDDAVDRNGQPVFENSDLRILYDFWASGGRMGFVVENKLDKPILIDWNRSHLVYNGFSFDYWNDSESIITMHESLTTGMAHTFAEVRKSMLGTSGRATRTGGSRTRAVTTAEHIRTKSVLEIPPGSKVGFTSYQLLTDAIYDCDFHWSGAANSDQKERVYDRSNTPLIFRNYITYSVGADLSDIRVIDNAFYLRSAIFLTLDSYLGRSTQVTNCNEAGFPYTGYEHAKPYRKPGSFYFRHGF